MIQLAEALIRKGIKFIWLVFTDGEIPQLPGFIKMPVDIDVRDWIAESDYLVQLSDTEGYCYAVMEAWLLGTMTITTPVPSFYEQGLIDGENGYVIDFEMPNLDNFVDKIYKGVHRAKYTPKKDGYEELIIKEPSKYSLDDYIEVKATHNFYDTERDTWVMNETPFVIEKSELELYKTKFGVVEL